MNIRENCPLCNNKSSSKEVLKIDQAFVNFINSYYGDASFKKISKYIDSDITYAQCNTCQLIYQQNILNDKGMFELYESLIDPQKSLNKRLSYSMTQNLRGVLLLFSLIFKIKKPKQPLVLTAYTLTNAKSCLQN